MSPPRFVHSNLRLAPRACAAISPPCAAISAPDLALAARPPAGHRPSHRPAQAFLSCTHLPSSTAPTRPPRAPAPSACPTFCSVHRVAVPCAALFVRACTSPSHFHAPVEHLGALVGKRVRNEGRSQSQSTNFHNNSELLRGRADWCACSPRPHCEPRSTRLPPPPRPAGFPLLNVARVAGWNEGRFEMMGKVRARCC